MRKRILILRDHRTKLRYHDEFIEVSSLLSSYRVAFIHLERIYLNKSIEVDIATCYAISQKVPLVLIDHNGYLLAEIKGIENA